MSKFLPEGIDLGFFSSIEGDWTIAVMKSNFYPYEMQVYSGHSGVSDLVRDIADAFDIDIYEEEVDPESEKWKNLEKVDWKRKYESDV